MKLTDYLEQRKPWDPGDRKRGKPVHYFLSLPLKVSVGELWPPLSDTSSFNRRMKTAAMTFSEKDGVLYGRSVVAGIRQEWEERPWEWEYGREIRNERIYSRGFLLRNIGHYVLEEKDGETVLNAYFGFLPKNPGGRLLLYLGKSQFMAQFRRVCRDIEKEIIESREPEKAQRNPLPFSFGKMEDTRERSKNSILKIRSMGTQLKELEETDPKIVDRFIDYILRAPDSALFRMRPFGLAEKLDADKGELLTIMLHATKLGLINMTWDVVCPHCQGIRERADHLWNVNKRSSCEVCEIEFDTSSINALEISFHINPYIVSVEPVYYCSAEPAKKAHMKFQKTLSPSTSFEYPLNLKPGRYRLRIKGEKQYRYIDLLSDREPGRLLWDNDREAESSEGGTGSVLVVQNSGDAPQTYILEETEEDQYALRPRDLFNFQNFRDLFSKESLSMDLSIDIGVQNILFVDVIKSSELYRTVGDSRAFSLIREVFTESHKIAVRYQGAIIKTMGDAVMLAFENPINALFASAAYMSRFDGAPDKKNPLTLRITLNRGSCLAVKLNSLIDYFGQPVNTVAKLQAYANAGEVVASESFMSNELIQSFLKKKELSPGERDVADLPGIGEVAYWRMRPRFRKNGLP